MKETCLYSLMLVGLCTTFSLLGMHTSGETSGKDIPCSLRCVREKCNGVYNKACKDSPSLVDCIKGCPQEENYYQKLQEQLNKAFKALEEDIAILNKRANTKN